jgi:hypothetical protein
MDQAATVNEALQPTPRRDFRLLRRWRRRTPGQNLVEFALIIPVLLLLIFGIIDLARVIHAQVTVTNAARQAIRFAVTGIQERDGNGNYIVRATSIISRARDGLIGLPLVETNNPEVLGWYEVRLNSRDRNGNNRPGNPGGPTEAVEVYVDYNVSMVTPLISAIFPRVEVHAVELAINEEWGAVQSFDHANLPPIPSPLPTRTPLPPSRTPTSTSTITLTPTVTRTPAVTQTPTATRTSTHTATPIVIFTLTPTITATVPQPISTITSKFTRVVADCGVLKSGGVNHVSGVTVAARAPGSGWSDTMSGIVGMYYRAAMASVTWGHSAATKPAASLSRQHQQTRLLAGFNNVPRVGREVATVCLSGRQRSEVPN